MANPAVGSTSCRHRVPATFVAGHVSLIAALFRRSCRRPQADPARGSRVFDSAVTIRALAAACALTASIGTTVPSQAQATALTANEAATAPSVDGKVAVKRTAREVEHFKALDAATNAVRATEISAEQAALVKAAAKAITDTDIAKALELRAQIKDPVGLKLVNWLRLRNGYGQLGEYEPFLADNPAWPDRAIMVQRFEELLFAEGGTAAGIKARLKDQEPRTGMGHAALASADLALGDTAAAKLRAVKVWREMSVPAVYEISFLERFGKFLTPADHQWRLDRLMVDDIRWAADRTDRIPVIRRQIERLADEDARKRGEARLMVFKKAEVDDAKYEMLQVLGSAPKTDYGFLYHRIQLLRRQNKTDDAVKLIQRVPVDPAVVANLDDWWAERRGLAYAVLNAGNPKLAYALVKNAGPLSVNPAKEQAFMAGWLAMRFLDDRKAASAHFEAARKNADGPLSRGRAGYWLGRLAEQSGNAAAATAHFTEAAREIDTFYGQLARLKLDPKNRKLAINYPSTPTADEIARFNALDATKAIVVAKKAGLDPAIVRSFFIHLRSHFTSQTEIGMLNHLATAMGDTQIAVRNAKAGVARGQDMLLYAYPVHTFPSFKPLGKVPELAVLLAIARQESEFNKMTVSGAGAKGLLQVMTVTAQHVCKDYKIKCEIDRLLPDASYNAQIAAAYVGDRMGEFRGSYVLTLAGYNAGPTRAREWARAFGDPRDPKIDPIDWIERIPFQETREYVAKVLSNIQIYRARLGDEDGALQLDLDLNRARGSVRADEPAAATTGAPDPG